MLDEYFFFLQMAFWEKTQKWDKYLELSKSKQVIICS